jgi:hypothetical protein
MRKCSYRTRFGWFINRIFILRCSSRSKGFALLGLTPVSKPRVRARPRPGSGELRGQKEIPDMQLWSYSGVELALRVFLYWDLVLPF